MKDRAKVSYCFGAMALIGYCNRTEAANAEARADGAAARARATEEGAAGLRTQLQDAEQAARGAAEAASAELWRERELASDVALNLQAQIGELKQHAAQVRHCLIVQLLHLMTNPFPG